MSVLIIETTGNCSLRIRGGPGRDTLSAPSRDAL